MIDSNNFSDYKGFIKEFNKNVFGDDYWQGNLDAFNDMLYGGYGTPQIPDETEDFIILWKNAYKSEKELGVKQRSDSLWGDEEMKYIPESNWGIIQKQKELAEIGCGETMFMSLVSIIASHKNIQLILN